MPRHVYAGIAALMLSFMVSLPGVTAPTSSKHPQPPLRPADLVLPSLTEPASPPSNQRQVPPSTMFDATCRRLIADPAIKATLLPPEAGTGGCGIAQPVRLDALTIDGTDVPLEPAPIANCTMAAAFADWVREDLAPAARALGRTLTGIRTAAAYECRGRNRQAGARISEHGRGNAIDLRALVVDGKDIVDISPAGIPAALAAAIRESACRRFTTVLGPESDGYHEDHLHVDLAYRSGGYRICQATFAGPAAPAR